VTSVAAALARASARLAAGGVQSHRHDAEALLAHVLGVDRAALGTAAGDWASTLSTTDARRFDELASQRAARVPLQHLLGTVGFRYLDLDVGPGVFVPRPETEVMTGVAVEELIRLAGERGNRSTALPPRAVDLCSGSGAIAAALATEAPGSLVSAVELSEDAYAFALRNAGSRGVDVRLGDIASAVDDLAGQVDVVIANPPYIPLGEFESVAPEAREHDPPLALWSGPDGLDAIRVVAAVAERLLVEGGLVLCEHADSQSEAVVAVFARTGHWRGVSDHRDLAGRPRFVSARSLGSAAAVS
jgi:release factor glutamine methyltransferase